MWGYEFEGSGFWGLGVKDLRLQVLVCSALEAERVSKESLHTG